MLIILFNMSGIPLPENAGASFFGFMGVSMALVLASNIQLN